MPDLQLLKGTKDYLPTIQVLRERIRDTIVRAFHRYGFSPIETPILNYFELLSSKYAGGAEILKETYKLTDQGERELALRYDLTVPFARFVGTYQPHQITLPFKRYEIGKVFRDGPVKTGRLREFTQCDADVVGVADVAAEAECLALAAGVFRELEVDAEARVGHRQLLGAILSEADVPPEGHAAAILSIDKLEKIGREGVSDELRQQGISDAHINALFDRLSATGTNQELLEFFRRELDSEQAKQALDDIERVMVLTHALGIAEFIRFVPSLARGLEIYTGTVFEFFVPNSPITSSIGSGGRYDRIVGQFLYGDDEAKVAEFPAVGMSFGLDVLAEAIRLQQEERGRESGVAATVVELLVAPMAPLERVFPIVQQFRENGIKVEVAVSAKRLKKALDFANRNGIPYVAIVGDTELDSGVIALKDMAKGEQLTISLEEAIARIKT